MNSSTLLNGHPTVIIHQNIHLPPPRLIAFTTPKSRPSKTPRSRTRGASSSNPSTNEKGPNAANARVLNYPTRHERFAVTMHKSSIEGDCRLALPHAHCEEHMSEHVDEFIVLHHERTPWEVKLKCTQNQYRLGQGWRDFVMATGLEVHDAVLFEKGEGSPPPLIYNVRIFKA